MRGLGNLIDYIREAAKVLSPEVLIKPPVTAAPQLVSGVSQASSDGTVLTPDQTRARYLVELALEQYALQKQRALTGSPTVTVRFSTLPTAVYKSQMVRGAVHLTVDSKDKDDNQHLLAIIARETARVILVERSIHAPQWSSDSQGKLADTVATLAGFGPILRRAYHRTTTRTESGVTFRQTTTMGALEVREIDELLRVRERIAADRVERRRCPIRVWRSRTMPCEGCYNDMGLPAIDDHVKLTCTTCGAKHDVVLQMTRPHGWSLVSEAVKRPYLALLDAHHGLPRIS